MSNLTDFKRSVQPGAVLEITNHHITREDHPKFGTTTRTVTKVNTASFYTDADPWPMSWPKASEIGRSGDVFNVDFPGKPGTPYLSVRVA